MPQQEAAWLDLSLLLREVYNGTDEDLNFEPQEIEYRDRLPVAIGGGSRGPQVSNAVTLPEPDFAALSTKQLEQLANAISPHVTVGTDSGGLSGESQSRVA